VECEGGEAVVGGVGGEGSADSEFVRGKGEWADQLEWERGEGKRREGRRSGGREAKGREAQGPGEKRSEGSGSQGVGGESDRLVVCASAARGSRGRGGEAKEESVE
jgi:hypothetical protein